jgi:hypothetical protein
LGKRSFGKGTFGKKTVSPEESENRGGNIGKVFGHIGKKLG